MSLRLVFFNRSFHPDITATGQLLTELCEDLIKHYNCNVTVIAGNPLTARDVCAKNNLCTRIIKREIFNEIEILRVNSTTFPNNFFLGRVSNYLTYFFFSFIASFKIKKPDLVIALTDPPIIGLIGALVSFRFHVPFLISVKDVFPEAAGGLEGYRSKIIDFLLDCINRFCLKRADYIVAVGRMMYKRLTEEKRIAEGRVSVIHDWADCSKIFPISKENPFSFTHNLADSFVVMYSGNIGASSGLETLIESAYILKDYKDLTFVIIGEGIVKGKLIKFANDRKLKNIKFFPYQPKETLAYSFSSADIFIVMLKKGLAGYSVPSKLYGILASGRPYVACTEEESELAEIAKEFDCGLLANPEDPNDLVEKILFFYKNKELVIKMGENARKAAVFFDRNLGTKAYYELFKKLVTDEKGI